MRGRGPERGDCPGRDAVGMIRELAGHARAFVRPLRDRGPHPPLPPPLPAGRVVYIPGRGETFLRYAPGPGDAPTVMLLHGWTLSADLNWFTGGYEVASRRGGMVAPDIRGHGRGLRSDEAFTLQAAADDIAGLIDELGLGPVVFVGYSMGSSIALLLAQSHPEMVAGLVLASTGLQWRSSLYERVLWKGMAGVEYVLRFGAPQGITDRYLRHAVQQSPELGPYRSWLKAEARRGDPGEIAAAGRQLADHDARPLAGGIDVPTVVVVTRYDRLIRARKQRELAKAIHGAQIVEVEGAHNAWMVKPVEFADALDRALGVVIDSLERRPRWAPGRRDKEAEPARRGVEAARLAPEPAGSRITGL